MKTSELIEPRLAKIRDVCRTMKYSLRTEEAYCGWVRRFIVFSAAQPDWRTLHSSALIRRFLESRADEWSASTQDQALNALAFYFKHILRRPMGQLGEWARAKRPKLLPTWLTHEDMMALLGHLRGIPRLMAEVDYGSGVRSKELSRLRVKDIDFTARTLTVRGGKGAKDRVTILPASVITPLREHLAYVRTVWESDRRHGRPGVEVPSSKFNGEDWMWFWVWPAAGESQDPRSGIRRRHHLHESTLGKALTAAVVRWGGNRRVTVHSLRHSFATTLLTQGVSIHVVQQLLGHEDIRTTAIYAHVLPRLAERTPSPLDIIPSNLVSFPLSEIYSPTSPSVIGAASGRSVR